MASGLREFSASWQSLRLVRALNLVRACAIEERIAPSFPVPFSGMVLAAGYGSRLRPLTDEIPKPLLPLGAAPLLQHTLQVLLEAGAVDLVVNTHHLAEQIRSFVQGLEHEVHVVHEPLVRGTAGGVAGARRHFRRAHVVVANGDIWADFPILELARAATDWLVLAAVPAAGAGTLGIGADGEVVRLRGERFGEEVLAADYIGLACLGPRALSRLPEEGCLVGDVALPLLREGIRVQALLRPGQFLDVGEPGAYLAANLAWLGGRAWVSPGALVAPGVSIKASVVGARAEVRGSGEVVDSVVLPGARALAPLARSIVLPSGRVVEVP